MRFSNPSKSRFVFTALGVVAVIIVLAGVLITTPTRADGPPTSSVYDGVGDPGPIQNPSPVPCVGGETVALIQDNVPWFAQPDPLGPNVAELNAQGKNFCIINSKDIGIANVSQFPEILISAAQNQTFYNNLFPGGIIHPALTAYVQNGGILSANLTDFASGPGAGGNWSGDTFIDGVKHVIVLDQQNNIADAGHPIIANILPCPSGNCAQVVDGPGARDDLDFWNLDSHGYFTNLPPGTKTILVDGTSRPVMVEYPFGNGVVIATLTTTEWRYVVFGGNKKLLANEIAYQDSLSCVSPDTGLNICQLQAGDILLMDAVGAKNKGFAGFVGTYWFHSGLYDGEGRVLEARGVFADDDEEVQSTPIKQTGFYAFANDWVVLRVKPEHRAKVADAIAWARERADTLVSDGGAVFMPVSKWFNPLNKFGDDEFYCSLFVWRAFKEQGLDLDFGLSPPIPQLLNQVLPDDLYVSSIVPPRRTTVVQDKNSGFLRTLYILLSPADLRVIDPTGNVTGVDPQTGTVINEIPGAFYSGPGAEPEWISVPNIGGTSTVEVHGTGSDTYSLAVQVFVDETMGSQVFQWETQPGQVDSFEVPDPAVGPLQLRPLLLTVPMDIKPQSCPNPFNVNKGGVLPVAILGTTSLNVNDVDVSTFKLKGVSPLRSSLEDVATPFAGTIADPLDEDDCTTDGPDGFQDLTLQFDAQAIVAALESVNDGDVLVLELTGNLNNGTPIEGQDVVRIIKK